MKLKWRLLFACLILGLAGLSVVGMVGCGNDDDDNNDNDDNNDDNNDTGTISFSAEIQPIFTGNCVRSGCHQSPGAPVNLNLSEGNAYSNIVNVPSGELPSMDLVEPGDSENSYLYLKIEGRQGEVGGQGSQMPLGEAPLAESDRNLISGWINEGALNN